jgi:lysophospholipase L1-like esterase
MLRFLSAIVITLCALHAIAVADDPKVQREDIEWTQIWIPHVNEHHLPRVLCVGDSICNGYYDGVANLLQNKAYVAKLTTSSSLGDPALLEQIKYLLSNYKFDVIHLNNGLHGFGYTEEQYKADIPKLLALIKQLAPQAKLILATSTAMRKRDHLAELGPENDRVVARNKIVVDVASKENVPVDNLYRLVVDHPEYWIADAVHFKPEGQNVEAKQVAEHILGALAK